MRWPRHVFVRTAEGQLTYGEAEARVAALAGGLRAAGVVPDRPVVIFMHNSLDQILAWFALARLGAVHVPINNALVGSTLTHVFRVTGARLAIVDAELVPALQAVRPDVPDLACIVVRGPVDPSGIDGEVVPFSDLAAGEPTSRPV